MPLPNKYLVLSPHAVLKNLELPCLYDIANDELYELNQDAYDFLLKTCQGENPPVRPEDGEFIAYCLSEGLATYSDVPIHRAIRTSPSPLPSLRYLELQITGRCNLQCRHCYLGDGLRQDLSVERIQRVLDEFGDMQGLRLLLSGGEPLLHPRFWELNDILRHYPFRSVLLSNGTLITQEATRRLQVHEVQISLDGMQEGHEAIRGDGTFRKSLQAIDYLQDAGIGVSIATMIHRKNLKEFEDLASLLESKHIREWNVDAPCVEGRLRENKDLWVEPWEAGPLLRYGFGGGFHGSENNSSCGVHLCAIMVEGIVCKCGLYSQVPAGSIEEGLRTCWARIPRVPLRSLSCDCPEIEGCRGGCRYRAQLQGDRLGPDLFQCYARGILKGGEPHDHQEGG